MNEKTHVLITGASSGLGEALALRLAARGCNLTLSARRIDRLRAVKESILKLSPKTEVLIIESDVADKESSRRLIKDSLEHFAKIDILIANAGQGMWSRFKDVRDPDQLCDLMKVNYMGVVYALFFALPHLRRSLGSFVAISSVQGVLPVAYHTGYVASKHAVNGLIETIRLEEPDVHFLLAQPSWISGTELRSNALSSDDSSAVRVITKHKNNVITADKCAEQIIRAIDEKKDGLFIPKKYRLIPLARSLFKSSVDRIVMKKVKGQLKN